MIAPSRIHSNALGEQRKEECQGCQGGYGRDGGVPGGTVDMGVGVARG